MYEGWTYLFTRIHRGLGRFAGGVCLVVPDGLQQASSYWYRAIIKYEHKLSEVVTVL
jgi:hypothetical protein